MKSRNQRMTEGLFLIYFLLLIWIIVFKMEFSIFDINELQSLNLDPYSAPARINGEIVYEEIIFNVLAFLPFGLYLEILVEHWKIYQKVFVFLLVSVSFEIVQYIFAIGASDITDVINNVLGGILGILLFKLLNIFMKNNHRTHKFINIISAGATLLVLIILFVLKIT